MVKQNEGPDQAKESESPLPPQQPKPMRQVIVTHRDAPPPSGKQSIHPRRPAPVVPSREERTESQGPERDNKSSGE